MLDKEVIALALHVDPSLEIRGKHDFKYFSAVHAISNELVVKRYLHRDFECKNPESDFQDGLGRFRDAEWEHVIARHIRSKARHVPEHHGIILAPHEEQGYDVYSVFQRLSYQPQRRRDAFFVWPRYLVKRADLLRRGFFLTDAGINNRMFGPDGLYFIDTMRWIPLRPFVKYEELKRTFAPEVFLPDGTRVDASRIRKLDDILSIVSG